MGKSYRSRKRNRRKQNIILVIVCEGESERAYFRRYRERNSGLEIKIPNSTATDPKNLVGFSLKQIDKFDLDVKGRDQVWCVFDADHHTDQEIQNARKNAKSKIKICLSNPSFELWYLLHFCYYDSRILNKDLIDKLGKHIPDYKKTGDYFDKLTKKRAEAIEHAKRLNKVHEKKHVELLSTNSNPSTQVFRLVDHIIETIGRNKSN